MRCSCAPATQEQSVCGASTRHARLPKAASRLAAPRAWPTQSAKASRTDGSAASGSSPHHRLRNDCSSVSAIGHACGRRTKSSLSASCPLPCTPAAKSTRGGALPGAPAAAPPAASAACRDPTSPAPAPASGGGGGGGGSAITSDWAIGRGALLWLFHMARGRSDCQSAACRASIRSCTVTTTICSQRQRVHVDMRMRAPPSALARRALTRAAGIESQRRRGRQEYVLSRWRGADTAHTNGTAYIRICRLQSELPFVAAARRCSRGPATARTSPLWRSHAPSSSSSSCSAWRVRRDEGRRDKRPQS